MFIKCNGITIHYQEYGNDSVVLLLHGGIITGHFNWKSHINYLAQFFRVIVPDTRGHGMTNHNHEDFSYKLLADDISTFIKKLNIEEPVIICGHSDGAIVGMHVAVHYPQLVKKLVIIGGTHLTGRSKDYYQGIQEVFCTQYPDKGPNIWCYCIKKPLHALWLWYSHKKMAWQQLMAKLWPMWMSPIQLSKEDFQNIKAATLIIVGDHDEFITVPENQQLVDMIPQAQLVVLKGYDHMFPIEFPRILQETLLPFLLDDK